VLAGSETRIPVIPKSYLKINTGPFVQTAYGLRLLRLPELERIRGLRISHADYPDAVMALGQGVQTNAFKLIFDQLEDHLKSVSLP
jgi:hypothetical protein